MAAGAMVSENYQLKWHSYGAHLHSSVATALNSDAFTDVSLLTLDGHQINAHRFVLAACSQYLQQVFKMQTRTAKNLPVVVVMPSDITYKTLKTLVQYMYCGETTVSNDILESVLRGGDILQVRGLWRPRNDTPPGAARTPVTIVQHPGSELRAVDPNVRPVDQVERRPVETITTTVNTPVIMTPAKENAPETNLQTNQLAPVQTGKETPEPPKNTEPENKSEDDYLVIKEEPLEWNEYDEVEISENEIFQSESGIKPEMIFPAEETEFTAEGEEMYSPLTCELCSETFTQPADWVKHIRTHTDTQPAKRQRRGRASVSDDDSFPPLQCDLCQKQFPTPGEWVRHIQSSHNEKKLIPTNHAPNTRNKSNRVARNVCAICNKKFPSHASMMIHRRTHTGEKPFVCSYCHTGFNVKSNLLRHLRTLHNKIINSSDVNPDVRVHKG